MPAPWDPKFDAYLVVLEGSRVSFVLDMEAINHAPVESHPLRLQVRISLLTPRDDGLSTPAEADDLSRVEDHVVGRAEEELDAIFVGRFTADGTMTFVMYLPEAMQAAAEKAGELLVGLSDVGQGYPPEWLTESDPEWRFYEEFLYPDDYSVQYMTNRALLETIRSEGDLVHMPRTIDHVALFASRAQALEASAGLRASGFSVDDPARALDEHDQLTDPEIWYLAFTREDALDGRHADEFCSEVLDVILACDGQYDGWGCELIRPEA